MESKLGEARGKLWVFSEAGRGREKGKKLMRDLEIKEYQMRLLEARVGWSNAVRVSVFQWPKEGKKSGILVTSRMMLDCIRKLRGGGS